LNLDWNYFKGDFDGTKSSMTAVLDDGYSIEVTLQENEDGLLVCTGLSISSQHKRELKNAINSRYLQLMGLGEILKSAREAYREMREVTDEAGAYLDAKKETRNWPNPGSTGHADKKYAQLAFLYSNLVFYGISNPIDELAKHMNCDRETASSRIAEARNRELLTRPSTGSFGGRLTSKARMLIGIERERK